jgi:hypothetical protein
MPDVTEWWNSNNGLEFLVRSGGYIAEVRFTVC